MLLAVHPLQPFVIHHPVAALQQCSQSPVAVSRLLPRQRHQFLTQFRVAIRLRLIPLARSIHLQELAGMALAQSVPGHYERHISPSAYKLQP